MKKLVILAPLFLLVFHLGRAQVTDYFYGVFTEYEDIDERIEFVGDAEEGGHLYVWNGFTGGGAEPFYGAAVISWKENPDTWDGFGIHSDTPMDMSNFEDGFLRFVMRSSNTDKDFTIGIQEVGDPANTDFVVKFMATETPYGFVRDGEWHELSIPLADFKSDDDAGFALDAVHLAAIGELFYLVGDVDIDLDEIYYAQGEDFPVLSVLDNQKELIRLYPNPANSHIRVSGIIGMADIEIINITGKTVKVENITGGMLLDISDLKDGVYFLKVLNGNRTICKKLLIN